MIFILKLKRTKKPNKKGFRTLSGFRLKQAPIEAKGVDFPEPGELKRGEFWCPYCGNASRFRLDKVLGTKRCPYCGISENDFYVKKINKLWR